MLPCTVGSYGPRDEEGDGREGVFPFLSCGHEKHDEAKGGVTKDLITGHLAGNQNTLFLAALLCGLDRGFWLPGVLELEQDVDRLVIPPGMTRLGERGLI